MEAPQTRYAQSGDLSIAYQVFGEGPRDLVFVPGLMSHIDATWALPAPARFFRRLASLARVIMLDKRGQGLSDSPPVVPTLEDDMQDLQALLDEVGSERATLFGYSEGAPASVLFAATYPDRIESLILFEGFVIGPARELEVVAEFEQYLECWGTGESLRFFGPSIATEERIRQFAAFERAVGSPGRIRTRWQTGSSLDITDVLPSVRTPALVLHRRNSRLPQRLSEEMAERLPNARLVLLEGEDHIPWVGDAEPVLDEIEEFMTGTRHAPEVDRVLSTVLFTDIVGSTEQAGRLGDSRWRALVETHDEIVRRALESHRGREVKTLGDGFLATFDGPARAIQCAAAVVGAVEEVGLRVRAGLHTGECELVNGDVRGMAVNIGARVGSVAGPGEVLVSSTVKDLVVGSGIEFSDRGEHSLKGVPGEWRLYAVVRN